MVQEKSRLAQVGDNLAAMALKEALNNGGNVKLPFDASLNEPKPTQGKIDILPLVLKDLQSRAEMGKQKYGTLLQSHNGRDALMDAYQEALDLVMYLRQLIEERKITSDNKEKIFKLCYIEGNYAYFTSQELSKQWGDDWDGSYENSGKPYSPCWHRLKDDCQCDTCKREWNTDGTPKWEIVKVVFGGPFHLPDSKCSVKEINNRAAPWLVSNNTIIMAGINIDDFIEVVCLDGGYALVIEKEKLNA